MSLFEGADVDNGGRHQATALDLLHRARDRLKVAPIADDATSIELLGKIGWALQGLRESQDPTRCWPDAAHRASTTSSDNDNLAAVVLDHYGAALVRGGRRVCGGDWPTLFGTLDDEADLRSRQGRYDDAMRLDQDVIALTDRGASKLNRDDRLLQLAQANSSLAQFAHESYRTGGLEFAQPSMKLLRELDGDRDTPFGAALRCEYGLALADAGDVMGGLAQLQQARRLQSEVFGAKPSERLRRCKRRERCCLGYSETDRPTWPTSRPTFHGRGLRLAIQAKHSRSPRGGSVLGPVRSGQSPCRCCAPLARACSGRGGQRTQGERDREASRRNPRNQRSAARSRPASGDAA